MDPLPLSPQPQPGGTCSRCGAFFPAGEAREVDGAPHCVACASRPEVEVLESFRRASWGRRDGWTYLVGMLALAELAVLLLQPVWLGPSWRVLVAGALAVHTAFFFGRRLARYALVPLPLAAGALAWLGEGMAVGPVALAVLLPLLVSVAIVRDARCRLFFRLPVPPGRLRKAWELYANNPPARLGLSLGLVALVFGLTLPMLAPAWGLLGLGTSVVGFRRSGPRASPRVGRRGQALAGMLLSAAALVAGLVFYLGLLPLH